MCPVDSMFYPNVMKVVSDRQGRSNCTRC